MIILFILIILACTAWYIYVTKFSLIKTTEEILHQDSPNMTNEVLGLSHSAQVASLLLRKCSFSIGGASTISKTVEEKIADEIYLKHNGRAMTVCFDALIMLGEPKTELELIIALNLCPYTGAGGRLVYIEYANRYLKERTRWYESADFLRANPWLSATRLMDEFIYYDLGKAYEGTYQLEQALTSYKKAHELSPSFAHYIVSATRVLNKMGQMDKSIKILESQKPTIFYTERVHINAVGQEEPNNFKHQIDIALDDTLGKKKRNYVYRPRPSS